MRRRALQTTKRISGGGIIKIKHIFLFMFCTDIYHAGVYYIADMIIIAWIVILNILQGVVLV